MFCSAEIGDIERGVSIEDANEGNGREMEPFGDHLRANQHIGLACTELLKEFVMASFVLSGVGIEADGADMRKDRMECALDLFGAGAFKFKTIDGLASGTLRRNWKKLSVAEMAGEDVLPFVKGQADRAMGTVEYVSAHAADSRGMKASAVEKNKRLFSNLNPFFQRV